MNDRLRWALSELDAMEQSVQGTSPLHRIDARAKLLVTLVFLVTMLSVPLVRLSEISLFFIYPVLLAARGGLRYGVIFRRSLIALPFVVLIGLFNLFYDCVPVFRIGDMVVTKGLLTFLSIILRGILSMQALLILVEVTGFYPLCRGLQRMGVPSLFVTQLLFVYRYLYVLIAESMAMAQARDARSFGRGSYPLRLWGMMIGQLLIRTFNRAEHIHRSMLARGFSGRIPVGFPVRKPWQRRDTLFLISWSAVLILLRLLPLPEMLSDMFLKFSLP